MMILEYSRSRRSHHNRVKPTVVPKFRSEQNYEMTAAAIDLDAILLEIDARGRYRTYTWLMLGVVLLLSAVPLLSYIFTAGQLEYRCRVPQCDRIDGEIFNDTWLPDAIPTTSATAANPNGGQHLSRCKRFAYVGDGKGGCNASNFDRSRIEHCAEFVFETTEVTIVREFNITCDDSDWKLALIGTLDYAAGCLLLPVCAALSDKYGRRPVLLANLVLSGIFGMAKSFATSYPMFAALEFVTAAVSSGTFMTVLVMGIESSTPTQRVFVGTILSAVFSFSQVVCGVLAAYVTDFRWLLRWLFMPNFVLLTFVWLVPESVRWLLTQNRLPEALVILVKAAKWSGQPLSAEAMAMLTTKATEYEDRHEKDESFNTQSLLKNECSETTSNRHPFVVAIRSRVLILRLINCLFAWFAGSFVYYGMNVHSVALGGSKYVNFIAVNLVELPAIFAAYVLMERVGRQRVLSLSLAVGGAACLASYFAMDCDDEAAGTLMRLVLFVVGKGAVTLALTVLYVYTTEMFPTETRQSFMNACSTLGAIGAMLAPLSPLLDTVWPPLPMVLFSFVASTSAALTWWLPETLGRRLPDTVRDAERLGSVEMLEFDWQKSENLS